MFAVKTRVEKLNRLFHILKIIGKKNICVFLTHPGGGIIRPNLSKNNYNDIFG